MWSLPQRSLESGCRLVDDFQAPPLKPVERLRGVVYVGSEAQQIRYYSGARLDKSFGGETNPRRLDAAAAREPFRHRTLTAATFSNRLFEPPVDLESHEDESVMSTDDSWNPTPPGWTTTPTRTEPKRDDD